MAPEYLSRGQLTEKVDVYSFGVVLLEIITGRQNNRSGDGLVALTWKHLQTGTVEELYDPNYHDSNVNMEIFRVVQIGLVCTQKIPSLRPTMLKVLQMLTTEEILPAPNTCEDPNYPLNAGASASVASVSHSSFYPR